MVHTETRRGGAHRDAVNSLTKTRLTLSTGAHSDAETWSTRGAHRDADGALAERHRALAVHAQMRSTRGTHTDVVNSRCTQRRGDVEHSQCTQTQ